MDAFTAGLLERVGAGIPEREARWSAPGGGGADHRTAMIDALGFIVAYRHEDSPLRASDSLLPPLAAALDHLAQLQGDSGLFGGGDNHLSPPDSSFTVNDACLAHSLAVGVAALEPARTVLEGIVERALPALIRGGVHTPNHRWELCAALARSYAIHPWPEAIARIDEWLAEGVDIDGDGMYSERSAIYAGAVSNDSLIALAVALDRPHLLEPVRRNLSAYLALFDEDGDVESVHSRRQDQWMRMPAGHFALQLRRFALLDGRGDFAWWSGRLIDTVERPERALAHVMLEPWLADPLPDAIAPSPAQTVVLGESGLARLRKPGWEATVFGGSDFAAHRRIASGLSTNPTFLRFRSGAAVLSDVRLSPHFFDLGTFRADGLSVRADGFVLRDTMSARYYQPLPAGSRSADGAYPVSDDGRFSAAMAFDQRPFDLHELAIQVEVLPHDDGLDLVVSTLGESTHLAIEFTLRPGGRLLGTRAYGDDHLISNSEAAYLVDGSALRITVSGDHREPSEPVLYEAGEMYDYLGGSNRTRGIHVLAVVGTPGTATVSLRAGAAV